MSKSIGRVVPAVIERPKRIAKALSTIFPKNKLAKCQAVTAQLFGFPDWHGMEQSVKAGTNPGPFDEDLPQKSRSERRTAQLDLVAQQLAGVDLDEEYPPPPPDPLDHLGTNRLRMAHLRLSQMLTADALFELTPTTRSHHSAPEPLDELSLCKTDEFASLPLKVGRWWRVNVPHQPEVATALEKTSLDVSSGTSILQFAAYWGTLCMYYANTIDWTMAMGVAQILAEGYSASQLSYSANLKKFGSEKPLTEDERRKLVEAIFHEKSESEEDFYRCFPRDDFIRAWLAQPEAFLANAKEALTILEDPHSYEAWAERDETASPNR